MRRALGAFLAVGLTAYLSPAAEPPAAVGKLVARLGADSFAEREAASRELLRLGPAALDTLTAAAAVHPDPETRRRAADLVEQLRRSADTLTLLAPKAVKLDYDRVPLGAALADLRTKTGVPLTLDQTGVADPLRPVTVKTGELPAWEAVEAFCRAAGLREVFHETLEPEDPATPRIGRRRVAYSIPGPTPAPAAGRVPVVLADGKAAPLPGDRSTAVRVLALPAAFPGNRVIRGAGQVVLNLDVTPLPGVKWDEVAAVRVLRAEDETGRPVTASHRPEPRSPGLGGYQQAIFLGGMQAQAVFIGGEFSSYPALNGQAQPNPRVVPITLRTDDRSVRSLRVFEGVVVGEITLTDQTLATVGHLSKAAGATALGPYGTRYTLVDYKALPDGRVSLKLRTEGPNPWTLQRLGRRGLGFNNLMLLEDLAGRSGTGRVRFKFTDAAGRPIPQPMTQSSSTSDDGIRQTAEVELVFAKRPDVGPPATLTVIGNKPATVEVPFRMTNVALP
ncbi:MAG TPA: hypothetical protein VFG68_16100 [Fimbriiglobus sp.]|nr:hypothetical protein [Fimbriiglobus sp.]